MACDPTLLAEIRARLALHEQWAELYRRMITALAAEQPAPERPDDKAASHRPTETAF